jgi:splicing suppressor protein 51
MPLSIIDALTGKATAVDDVDLPPAPDSSSSSSTACAKCQKAAGPANPLKRCAKCREASYCNRECQKADWKNHKKDCVRTSQAKASHTFQTTLDSLAGPVLQNIPREDVYRRLIDSYRLRITDTYNYEGRRSSEQDALPLFQEFLTKCEEGAKNMLPPWWESKASKECVKMAMEAGGGQYLARGVEKGDVIEQYSDSMMPLKLRRLAEKAYGRAIRV